MYFNSRAQAGQKLAAELAHHANQNAIVVALNSGGVEVGHQVAQALSCPLALLFSENVTLPGEHSALGMVAQDGSFAYSSAMSEGEVDEYYAEFHGYIEDQKREKFQKLNRLLGEGGAVEEDMLKDRTVILVADGLKTGTSLEAASLFLKPIRIKRLVIAVPVASVPAVDRMHILADELHCLSVTENFISTDHYYETNNQPSHEEILAMIGQCNTNQPGQALPPAP